MVRRFCLFRRFGGKFTGKKAKKSTDLLIMVGCPLIVFWKTQIPINEPRTSHFFLIRHHTCKDTMVDCFFEALFLQFISFSIES